MSNTTTSTSTQHRSTVSEAFRLAVESGSTRCGFRFLAADQESAARAGKWLRDQGCTGGSVISRVVYAGQRSIETKYEAPQGEGYVLVTYPIVGDSADIEAD